MAAKTGELTAYGARKKEPPKRLWGLGSSDGSVRCDVSNCGIGNSGLWLQLGGKGLGSHQWAERHQFWQVNPLFHFWGDLRVGGPIGSSNWYCSRGRRQGTKHTRGTQAGDKRGLKKGYRGLIESRLGKGLTGICRSSNN